MTPFESCVAALRGADTQTFFKALDAGLKARLDTLTHEYRFGDHIQ